MLRYIFERAHASTPLVSAFIQGITILQMHFLEMASIEDTEVSTANAGVHTAEAEVTATTNIYDRREDQGTSARVYVCACACVCACVYVCVCACMCMCICMCVVASIVVSHLVCRFERWCAISRTVDNLGYPKVEPVMQVKIYDLCVTI